MTNQEFFDYVKEHIKEYLPDTCQNAAITLAKATRANEGETTRLIIQETEGKAAPQLELDPFAAEARGGRPLNEILEQLADAFNSFTPPDEFATGKIDRFVDYATARSLLATKLCDPRFNRDYLEDKIWRPLYDLALFCRIEIPAGPGTLYNIVITKDLLDSWGLTPDELFEEAIAAERARRRARLWDVRTEISSPTGSSGRPATNLLDDGFPFGRPERALYFLSHTDYTNGAVVIGWEDALRRVSEVLGGDYLLGTSSIHELLVMRGRGQRTAMDMRANIRDVNADPAMMPKTDVLSDQIYQYRSSRGRLERVL